MRNQVDTESAVLIETIFAWENEQGAQWSERLLDVYDKYREAKGAA